MTKAIIPCAGYGTRMNMEHNQSKEMLIDPVTKKPLIDYHLDLCKKYGLEPIVISRIEKEDLNKKLRDEGIEHIVLKKPGREWPDTVLKSQGLWGHENILLLPDTRFSPEKALGEIKEMLDVSSLVIGIHNIPFGSSKKWGVINNTGIYEKPDTIYDHYRGMKTDKAWGVIGFNKTIGHSLFTSFTEFPHPDFIFKEHGINPSLVKLDNFKDITREGVIESYESS